MEPIKIIQVNRKKTIYVSHLAISQSLSYWQSLTYYSGLQEVQSKCNLLGEKDARNFTQNSYFKTSLIIQNKLKWLYLYTFRDDLLRENKDLLQCFNGGWNDKSSILTWGIPWTEEPGGPRSKGSKSWTWFGDHHHNVLL